MFEVNIGEDMWGKKCFSGEVVGVGAIGEARGEIVFSTGDCKTDTVIGDGY